MTYKLIISSVVLSVFLLTSCQSNEHKEKENFIKLIKATENNKALKFSDSLANLYYNFSEKFPSDSFAGNYMFKSAEFFVKLSQFEKAAKIYEKYAEKYPQNNDLSPDALMRAAAIYEQFEPDKTRNVYKKLMDTYPNHERYEEAKAAYELTFFNKQQQDSILMDRIKKNNPDFFISE